MGEAIGILIGLGWIAFAILTLVGFAQLFARSHARQRRLREKFHRRGFDVLPPN